MTNAFVVLRFGDLLEVHGECPWCPVWEDHVHLIVDGEVDRSDFLAVAP